MFKFPPYLIDEFRKDWEAALRPDVRSFLNRCHPDFRDELAQQIGDYLEWAPTPPYSDVQRARLAEHVDEMVKQFEKDPNIMRRILADDDNDRKD